MKPTLVILAAGMGSRYGGLKQMDPMGPSGEVIIDYSIFDAIRAGFGKVVFVIRRDIEADFKEAFGDKLSKQIPVEYVYQEPDVSKYTSETVERSKPWGTAQAVLSAKDVVKEPFAVINADDYYGKEAYELLVKFLSDQPAGNHYSMVGYELPKTLSEFGTVSRGVCKVDENRSLTEIVERKKVGRDEAGTIRFHNPDGERGTLGEDTIVSMNMFGFTPTFFDYIDEYFGNFVRENIKDPSAEMTIPDILNELIAKNEVSVKVLTSRDSWFGVTYKEDKPDVIGRLNSLIEGGVYPDNLWGN
ncbi:dTDP-glucose pyrophosphorylase [Catalinimonas alkaloidigena]|uniref:dTDP-glucose pyrophosphorylase n=1 Tax=Catalinimonas alkaloidigena TaxID=1075417 RepID=A0A1G9R5K7_9BACT|nr:sugar phosphate nucleotidyltransferase [Catalinimonas alkaloidigena]SDM18411.1 dTDP-glucose pyrophosphorylase [Catalinimonas alkaloidigena]